MTWWMVYEIVSRKSGNKSGICSNEVHSSMDRAINPLFATTDAAISAALFNTIGDLRLCTKAE